MSAFDVCAKLACNSRSTRDIVWSCVSTITLCTWVSVHPNIPDPSENFLAMVVRRMKLMVIALIAPEAIILWAIRQWLVTHRWAKSRGEGWTQTHAFFAIMGGFMNFVDGEPSYVLMRNEDANRAPRLFGLKRIDSYLLGNGIKHITKQEIEDKSKANILAKVLILLQTSWFALECTSRVARHLPLTLLELETVGFAVLNLVSYILWWHKPLDVQCALPVQIKSTEGQPTVDGRSGGEGEGEMTAQDEVGNSSHHGIYFKTQSVGSYLERFVELLVGHEHYRMSWNPKTVPLFFSGSAGNVRDSAIIGLMATAVASVFGAIHCIGWNSQFASTTEQHLWRIGSSVITIIPWPLWVLTTAVHAGSRSLPGWLIKLLCTVGYVGTSFYALARIVLLALAALSLRALPRGSFETIGWTAYLPHF